MSPSPSQESSFELEGQPRKITTRDLQMAPTELEISMDLLILLPIQH